jgi:hypothetical protein
VRVEFHKGTWIIVSGRFQQGIEEIIQLEEIEYQVTGGLQTLLRWGGYIKWYHSIFMSVEIGREAKEIEDIIW